MEKASITLEEVSINFPATKEIITYPNFTFPENGLVAVTGQSGSGKSTLVKIIMGLFPNIDGDVLCNGELLNFETEDTIVNFSYSDQNLTVFETDLFHNITLKENKPETVLDERFMQLITDLNLQGLSGKKISEKGKNLSGGQRQRIGIARALYASRQFYIFDEPTNGLDPENKAIVVEALRKQSKLSLVITITHDKELFDKCDRKLEL